jgi:hypothetical protein
MKNSALCKTVVVAAALAFGSVSMTADAFARGGGGGHFGGGFGGGHVGGGFGGGHVGGGHFGGAHFGHMGGGHFGDGQLGHIGSGHFAAGHFGGHHGFDHFHHHHRHHRFFNGDDDFGFSLGDDEDTCWQPVHVLVNHVWRWRRHWTCG